MRLLAVRAALIVGFALSWEYMSGGIDPTVKLWNPAITGRPTLIVSELAALFSQGEIWRHLATTASEFALGLVLGWMSGSALGLLFAHSVRLDRTLIPFMNGVNALPHLALAPLLISWLGIGLGSKIAVSALMALFPIFYNVYQGAKSVHPQWIEVLKVMGARRSQVLKIVVAPALVPWLLSGLRISAGLALVGAVIGEFIGSTQGLGYLMLFAQGFLQTNRALAILALLALWGIALDAALRWIERVVQPWKPLQVTPHAR
jgi:NitT/TauT family transport system permease protein